LHNIMNALNATELCSLKQLKVFLISGPLQRLFQLIVITGTLTFSHCISLQRRRRERSMMEKFWRKDGDGVHQTITQGSQKLALFLNPETPTQLRPLTVVLHGPAGVGKTTLAKKVMLDWTRDSLAKTLSPAFYLSCKELNRKGTCTFAELISKNTPDAQEARPEARAPAQKLLFVVDGFDELRVPSGSLIHDICSDWNMRKFGLANERMAGELETTFGCRVTTGVAQELLKSEPFWTMDLSEVMRCLHESQEELLVRDAMDHVTEVSLRVKTRMDLVHSSFCLRHCQNLQKILLQVEKGIFLESDTALESDTPVERSQQDHHALCLWTDLCSVFRSNKNLSFLDVGQSFLSHSSVRILCEQITHVTCHLQKVVIKNVSPADAYGDFCLAFVGKKTLTHLTLEGSVHSDKMLLLLCETLKHSQCNLQYLRLGPCSNIPQQWDDFSLALKINQSLKYLDLTASELLDAGVKLLCATLRHPKCFLQRLSLENCHLTGACCKELSSALIVNQSLTHLCLAKNNLGDSGVKLLCEGLSYSECQLQTLVLWCCNITRRGCKHISKLLQGDSSLTHLDLGFNPIATGLWFLCEALKKPNCNLKYLGLCGCSITSLYSRDLASTLTSNQKLETLDLGQNIFGKNGIIVLFEALKQNNSPLKMLRLKMDGSSVEMQMLLEEVKDSNPTLTIDCEASRTTRSSYCDFFSSML
ncbi:NACHT, LRR and PYD domains-containing protein 7, partial [Pteropus vampyrus]|uniref:NACHT, LRR and PYD domains-containing protein 7 n=1 Tax=Pteropus vampyrus TaxID=132908 RepID=A0A6P6BTR4_PTEVA